jgi:glycosyltransferase involved in cell wall biosynthesis
MRILMVSPNPLDATLGASKVTLELSAALNSLPDVQCDLRGPDDVGAVRHFNARGWADFNAAMADFVRRRADEYDVVDVDHEHLPFPRTSFASRPLLVARSVLLVHHLDTIRFPRPRTVRDIVSRVRHAVASARFRRHRIVAADATMASADLVNVSNRTDKAVLIEHGVPASKIVVLPFGMTAARRQEFAQVPSVPASPPVIAFVGSFDFRKGAADFPKIFARIRIAVPDARLALFGTAGHFRTVEDVRRFFPAAQRDALDIHPKFDPVMLPALLARCAVGIFPSYCEGFGFGVLEMLAAGVPVFAYDAPGPPEMLDADHLVAPGETRALADKVIAFLQNRPTADHVRTLARQVATRFDWLEIARRTAALYAQHVQDRGRIRSDSPLRTSA